MLLPMRAGDDSAHSQNEKINVRNYIEGVSTKCDFKNPTIIIQLLYHVFYLVPIHIFIMYIMYNNIFFIFLQTKLMAAYLYEVSKIKN